MKYCTPSYSEDWNLLREKTFNNIIMLIKIYLHIQNAWNFKYLERYLYKPHIMLP